MFEALGDVLGWLFSRPIDQMGHVFYVLTLLLGVLCIARGHRQGKINLWHLVTATDRNGIERTDGRKLFEVIGMSVMTITFYFLTVTARLTEWYVLIFALAVIGGRVARDMAQIKQAALDLPKAAKPKGDCL